MQCTVKETESHACALFNIGGTNQYVEVNFEPGDEESVRIVCTFLNQQDNPGEISCDVVYWPCRQQDMTTQLLGIRSSSNSNTVIIDLPISLQSWTSDYCYSSMQVIALSLC